MKEEGSTQQRRVVRRYTAEDRKRLMLECQESGLSRKAFCEQRGINVTTFHGWFHEKARKARKQQKPPKAKFTEVKLTTGASAPIEVLLPNGARVQIRHHGNPEELARLIRGVAGC